MNVNGILLCGGRGTRLLPTTSYLNKHLIPIYDKPMVYYSLSILLMSGVNNISIIHNSNDKEQFENLLGDGEQFGIKIKYVEQPVAGGIPEAINLATEAESEEKTVTVLGDNFIFGEKFYTKLEEIINNTGKSSIFSQVVKSPEEFGVVEVVEGEIISIQEKPSKPKSDYIAVGLYLFDNLCFEYIKSIQKSDRGEYEITSLIEKYLENNALNFQFTNGWWVDAGTPEAIQTIEKLI